MKRLVLGVVLCVLAVNVLATDVDITVTIPEAQVERVKTAVLALNPKPDGYTDMQWMKEILRRFIRDDIVLKYERQQAYRTAGESVAADDSVAE